MFRIISFIIYVCMDQSRKESQQFFWEIYDEVKRGKNTVKSRICGCVLHKIFRENGANIPIETRFEGHPFFPHGLNGIFISQGAVIGENCTIFQQVTIGSNTLKDSRGFGAPHLGKNVYIGAGAKIIGNVKIGDNCRIGANCVVTSDIPDNATVVLEHPRVIVHEMEQDNDYQEYANCKQD